jgi:hypothetical protein
MKVEKLRIYHNEEFKEIEIDKSLKLRYAISNFGRVVSFTTKIENGRLLKGSLSSGYRVFRFKTYRNGKVYNSHFFISRLVADYFIPKTSDDQVHILHLDYNYKNDAATNLKWATAEERLEYIRKSPYVIQARKNFAEHKTKTDAAKLTVTRVMYIKRLLADPDRKTRLKMIAKQFGVSVMQISRIKSGENWGSVKI